MKNEEYLWDRSGKRDDDVARLEQIMAPLAWSDDEPRRAPGLSADDPRPAPLARSGSRLWIGLASVAAAAALVLMFVQMNSGRSESNSDVLSLRVGGETLLPGALYEARDGEDNELRLGEVGWLDLAAGSRLRVDQLDSEEVVLHLERGELSAFISPSAKPEFFNIDTPATRCVDLGCAYDLFVLPDGDTSVGVTIGRVAFRDGEDEVFIPAGAVCRASRERGAGTPRFRDTSEELRAELDLFDLATDRSERQERAESVCSMASDDHDALPLWHFLQDDDVAIALVATQALVDLVGTPSGLDFTGGGHPDAEERSQWREFLWPDPYR